MGARICQKSSLHTAGSPWTLTKAGHECDRDLRIAKRKNAEVENCMGLWWGADLAHTASTELTSCRNRILEGTKPGLGEPVGTERGKQKRGSSCLFYTLYPVARLVLLNPAGSWASGKCGLQFPVC